MHEEWTDRLSDFLDGELSPGEHAAVQSHLEVCRECANVLSELRTVMDKAARLEEKPPQNDLWPGIQARIQSSQLGPRPQISSVPLLRRRVALSVPQLIAASLALVMVSGGTAWLMVRPWGGDPLPTAVRSGDAPSIVTSVAADPVQFGETGAAIAELELRLAASRERLDPETLRVIDANLAVIDVAIAEVRRALAGDPANTYLNMHLADTMRRKLELLQDMDQLVGDAVNE